MEASKMKTEICKYCGYSKPSPYSCAGDECPAHENKNKEGDK